jgi:intron-binding protein aquarius
MSTNNSVMEPGIEQVLPFADTFVDAQHVRDSFPLAKITVDGAESPSNEYELTFRNETSETSITAKAVRASRLSGLPPPVRFTPPQVAAIRSGMSCGLTLIVGPPGTGKTDVAVQIVSNLYNYKLNTSTGTGTGSSGGGRGPECVLLVARSVNTLDELLAKLATRGINPSHMVRLGRSETGRMGVGVGGHVGDDYSRNGRVNWYLHRRLELLQLVQELSVALSAGDAGSSCETAQYFFLSHIQPLMERYGTQVARGERPVRDVPFPAFFARFFVFPDIGGDEQDQEMVAHFFENMRGMFTELQDFRPMELLRGAKQRGDFITQRVSKSPSLLLSHYHINIPPSPPAHISH